MKSIAEKKENTRFLRVSNVAFAGQLAVEIYS